VQGLSWWHAQQDALTYGPLPRTFQLDAIVGQHDGPGHPSHFLVVNYHRQIIIEEWPGGDPTHVVTYLGPVLLGSDVSDATPVTLSVADVNGDGKPDLELHVLFADGSAQNTTIVFLNTGSGFRPVKPGEPVQLSS
jgi:hypothetical protein